MRIPIAAMAAAAVLLLPAAANADPPITPPDGATCTFRAGITTCVQSFGTGTRTETTFADPRCPSGEARSVTTSFTTVTTTTRFRGTHQQGPPQTEVFSSQPVTITSCVPA